MSEVDNGLGTMLESTPAEVTPEVDAPETTVEVPESPEPAGGELPQETENQPEERQQPTQQPTKPELAAREVTKMFRELREAHPEKAQLLRQAQDAFFRAQTFSQHYETPEAAQRAKATFEALGGEEGISRLQQSADQIRAIDEMAASGDPKLIDDWAKQNRDGFIKAVPHALESLEKADPRAYQETVRPHLIQALRGSGLKEAIGRIAWMAQQTQNEQLTREISGVSQWLDQLDQEEQRRQEQRNDPRQKEFDQQRQSIATEKARLRSQQVAGEIQPHLQTGVGSALDAMANTQKIPLGDSRDSLIKDVIAEINDTLAADKLYHSNLSALAAKGDVKAIVNYMKSSVDAVKGKATRTVWLRRVAPFAKPGSPQNGQQQRPANQQNQEVRRATANASPLQLPGKPKMTDIDWGKDPDRLLFISGRAYLRNGKFVSWKR